jgi:hypothetical protein
VGAGAGPAAAVPRLLPWHAALARCCCGRGPPQEGGQPEADPRPPPPPLPRAAGLGAAAMSALGEGAATSNRILEREARKSALFVWLSTFVWSDSTGTNWLKVGQTAVLPLLGPAPPPRLRHRPFRAPAARPPSRPPPSRAPPQTTHTPSTRPPQVPGGPAALGQDQYRSLWASFAGSELARAQVPRMARHLAGKLGLTASSKADPQEALGERGAANLHGLVLTAMLAHLRVKGCGVEQRITVRAQRQGKSERPGPLAAPPPRRCPAPALRALGRALTFAAPFAAGPSPVHPDFHNVRMTVTPHPPFDDVPPARPGEHCTVLLTCKPGVVARIKAAAADADDVEAGQEQAAVQRVVVQEDVVAAIVQDAPLEKVAAAAAAAAAAQGADVQPAPEAVAPAAAAGAQGADVQPAAEAASA